MNKLFQAEEWVKPYLKMMNAQDTMIHSTQDTLIRSTLSTLGAQTASEFPNASSPHNASLCNDASQEFPTASSPHNASLSNDACQGQ